MNTCNDIVVDLCAECAARFTFRKNVVCVCVCLRIRTNTKPCVHCTVYSPFRAIRSGRLEYTLFTAYCSGTVIHPYVLCLHTNKNANHQHVHRSVCLIYEYDFCPISSRKYFIIIYLFSLAVVMVFIFLLAFYAFCFCSFFVSSAIEWWC